LHYAAAAGARESLIILALRGADIKARDSTGAPALHLGNTIPCFINFALEYGIDLNAKDDFGRSPLHYLLILGKRSGGGRFRKLTRDYLIAFGVLRELAGETLRKAGALDFPNK